MLNQLPGFHRSCKDFTELQIEEDEPCYSSIRSTCLIFIYHSWCQSTWSYKWCVKNASTLNISDVVCTFSLLLLQWDKWVEDNSDEKLIILLIYSQMLLFHLVGDNKSIMLKYAHLFICLFVCLFTHVQYRAYIFASTVCFQQHISSDSMHLLQASNFYVFICLFFWWMQDSKCLKTFSFVANSSNNHLYFCLGIFCIGWHGTAGSTTPEFTPLSHVLPVSIRFPSRFFGFL